MTYLSVKEAAEIVGKNERTIRRWIKAKKIKTSIVRGRFHIDEESLSEYSGNKHSSAKNSDSKSKKTTIEKSKSNYSQNLNNQIANISKLNADNIIKNNKNNIHNNNKNIGINYNDKNLSDHDKHEIMSGQIDNNRYNHVQSDKEKLIRATKIVEFLRTQNMELKTRNENLKQIDLHINPQAESRLIREGKEYVLDENVRTLEMSENGLINMSVKKFSNSPITSQVTNNYSVEMSDYNADNMSEGGLINLENDFDTTNHFDMSDFDGHLSTKMDMPVDKYFDGHGKVNNENPFSGDADKMSGHLFGHNNRTNILSEKLGRQIHQLVKSQSNDIHTERDVINISAYATRLIDEKERVAKKLEEQNDFLKNELLALRKEITDVREVMTGESQNRAKLTDFLMESHSSMQKSVTAMLNETNKPVNDYKISIPHVDRKNVESVRHTNSNLKKTEQILEKNNLTEPNFDNKERNYWIIESQKIFLTGVGVGMVLGFMMISFLIWMMMLVN